MVADEQRRWYPSAGPRGGACGQLESAAVVVGRRSIRPFIDVALCTHVYFDIGT